MNLYRYAWGNNDKRESLKNRTCRVLSRGPENSVEIEFLDTGEREIISRYSLRRITLDLAGADKPTVNRFRFNRGFNTCTPIGRRG